MVLSAIVVASIARLASCSGVNGLLFNNTGEMADVILKLKCDVELRQRLGANARKTIEERFSLDRCVEQYRALYE